MTGLAGCCPAGLGSLEGDGAGSSCSAVSRCFLNPIFLTLPTLHAAVDGGAAGDSPQGSTEPPFPASRKTRGGSRQHPPHCPSLLPDAVVKKPPKTHQITDVLLFSLKFAINLLQRAQGWCIPVPGALGLPGSCRWGEAGCPPSFFLIYIKKTFQYFNF